MSTLRLLIVCLALAASTGAAPARAGSFTDLDARVFTLRQSEFYDPAVPLGPIGRLRPLADGSVVFLQTSNESDGMVWRLGLDGRYQAFPWAGRVTGLATDRSGTILVLRAGAARVERLDVERRRRRLVADLSDLRPSRSREFTLLAALDDGAIVVSDRVRTYRLARDGTARRARLGRRVDALAALDDGSFAATLTSRTLVRVGRDGRGRVLARNVTGSLIALPGGRLVTLVGGAPAIIDAAGAVKRYPWGEGDGDGHTAAETTWVDPPTMTVARDGSLIVALPDGRLRALVPADSPRARIAMLAPQDVFTHGQVPFVALPRGTVTLEVLRSGRPVVVAEASTDTGVVFLPTALAPDLYDLRLRHGRLVTRAVVGVRTTLTVEEANAFYNGGDGDEAGGVVQRADGCVQTTPATVDCAAFEKDWNRGDDESYASVEVPLGPVHISVGPDGLIRAQLERRGPPPESPRLTAFRGNVTVTGAEFAMISSHAALATATVSYSRADYRGTFTLTASSPVTAGVRWTPALMTTSEQRKRLARWKRARLGVVAVVSYTVVTGTADAPITVVRRIAPQPL